VTVRYNEAEKGQPSFTSEPSLEELPTQRPLHSRFFCNLPLSTLCYRVRRWKATCFSTFPSQYIAGGHVNYDRKNLTA
jgi:hypothetical protein